MTIAMTPEVTAGTGAVRILLEVSYQLSAISDQPSASGCWRSCLLKADS
jgi:hypothetical protein